MGARQFVPLVAVALCLGVVVSMASGAGTTGTAAQIQSQQVTPDTVVLRADVQENGTATWDVVYRTRLDDAETTDAFRSYKADVEENSSEYTSQFVGRMSDPIRSAENATGREMNGTNYSVRADIREFPQRYGIVVYSFRWHGFAATDGNELRIGDSLSGLFLNEKTRLLISWPEGYEVETIRPEPDERRSRSAVWTGPTDFAEVHGPRVTLTSPAFTVPDLPWRTAAGVAVIGIGVAGGLWYYRNHGEAEERTEEDEPPEDLLSNEERVLRLLEEKGGRVKQKAVVDELGWTEAKTSQVVGSLREQGKIESFRLGRENVLALSQERQEP